MEKRNIHVYRCFFVTNPSYQRIIPVRCNVINFFLFEGKYRVCTLAGLIPTMAPPREARRTHRSPSCGARYFRGWNIYLYIFPFVHIYIHGDLSTKVTFATLHVTPEHPRMSNLDAIFHAWVFPSPSFVQGVKSSEGLKFLLFHIDPLFRRNVSALGLFQDPNNSIFVSTNDIFFFFNRIFSLGNQLTRE